MKKSILNSAITLAMSTTLLSGAVLYAQAYADSYGVDNDDWNSASSLTNDEYDDSGYVSYGTVDTDFYTEMFSNDASSDMANDISNKPDNQTQEQQTAEKQKDKPAVAQSEQSLADTGTQNDNTQHDSIEIAQLGAITTIVEDDVDSRHDALLDILTADLSLDVYFRSGSTNIESFYPARLAAIADLLNAMDALEIHLDGYTDRRGDKSQNITLANERIEKVRQQLIDAGIDESRIISRAFGEMKMVSAPGDLDGYTFDRKVVIRFERSTADSIHNMKAALSEMPENDPVEVSISPVAADTSAQIADAGTRF